MRSRLPRLANTTSRGPLPRPRHLLKNIHREQDFGMQRNDLCPRIFSAEQHKVDKRRRHEKTFLALLNTCEKHGRQLRMPSSKPPRPYFSSLNTLNDVKWTSGFSVKLSNGPIVLYPTRRRGRIPLEQELQVLGKFIETWQNLSRHNIAVLQIWSEHHTSFSEPFEEDHIVASVITESQWKDTFDADLHRDAYHIYSNGTEGTRQLTGFYTIPNKGIPFCVRRLWSTRLNPAHLASMQNSVSACLHGAIAQSDSNGTSSAIVQAREERLGRKSMFAELDENFDLSGPVHTW